RRDQLQPVGGHCPHDAGRPGEPGRAPPGAARRRERRRRGRRADRRGGPDVLDGVDLGEWDRVFAVNVRGLFQITRACVPLLRAAGGSVVNVASIVGLRPGPQPLAYAASKAAVVSLTRTLSRVLAPEVRVNAVAPGWIAGEWMQRTLGDNYERLMERRATWTPMKRNVTVDDVAETVFSLITSNPFVTGETIVIDGGYAATS